METQNLRSRKCLSSFIKYCVTHPDERFWQALKNWSGYYAIRAKDFRSMDSFDTFYFEGKRHDEEQ